MQVYTQLARTVQAYINCVEKGNTEWQDKHEEWINKLIADFPHGSGLDGKTELDLVKSTGEKLIIRSEFHCMNENGYYDGWVSFTVTVKPSLQFGFSLNITGNFGKYQDVKEYLYELFSTELGRNIEE